MYYYPLFMYSFDDDVIYNDLLVDLQRIEELRLLHYDYEYADDHITKLIDSRFKLFSRETYYKNVIEPNKKR
jgi:hypothetical protein